MRGLPGAIRATRVLIISGCVASAHAAKVSTRDTNAAHSLNNNPQHDVAGPLQSAFVDVYPDQIQWGVAEWTAELQHMKSAGVRQLIFAGVVRLSSSESSTPPGTAFYPINSTHPLLRDLRVYPHVLPSVMKAAEVAGVSVVLGLIRAGYSALPNDRLAIGKLAAASADVLLELSKVYGPTSVVRGVYFPQELANGKCDPGKTTSCTICCDHCTCCFGPEEARKELVATYLGPLSRQVKRVSREWKVWMAPDAYLDRACPPLWPECNAYCGRFDGNSLEQHSAQLSVEGSVKTRETWCGTPRGTYFTPKEWASWWARTLADVPDIDVIAHQDGAGDHSSLTNITEFFTALRATVRSANPPRQFWSDLEAFAIPAPPAPPGFPTIAEAVSPWARIEEQLATERPLVDGFTTWEWHKYFSPFGGPQLAFNYYSPEPATATVNSNASLHNFIELLRRQSPGEIAPLQLISVTSEYSVSPKPIVSAGHLTDGLPHWNMGGPLSNLQVQWGAGVVATITLTLPAPTNVCCVRLFAARSTKSHIELPTSVDVTAGSAAMLNLEPTTRNDDATNLFWGVYADNACVKTKVITFHLHPADANSVAVSEVEVYTSN